MADVQTTIKENSFHVVQIVFQQDLIFISTTELNGLSVVAGA